ncbi:MAG: fibronectin type III domain-containing protein, partial [Thermoguttaceae bacterium]|nr:fibronectin type III domain-containing protein [Thermoguttaceae bacterium]
MYMRLCATETVTPETGGEPYNIYRPNLPYTGYSAQVVDGAKVISLENLPKGEYVIQVYHTNSTASTPYTLTIEPSKPEADDKYEGETNNDTLAYATDLGWVGSLAIDAKAGPSRNIDCYKFTLLGQGTADNYVGLNYVKASNVQLNFRIYNAAGDEIFSNVHNWATNKIENFSLEGLAAGDYYVEIVANQNLDVFSKYTLTINAPKVEPSAPTNFKATENVSDVTSKITKNETTLAWDAVENATYYEIRYTTDVNAANPTWSEIEKVDGLSQAVSLAYATSYKYQVRAVTVYNDNLSGDPAVEGAWTDLEFATVDAPVAPTQLTVSKLDPETHTVKLTWKDVVDENEYQVYLLNADDEVVAESDLAANQTSWTPNYQFDLGGSYHFEIRAKNNAGNGDFAALDFTVEDVPAQPTELAATVDAAFNATLTWTDVATTETGYEVAILDENNEWKVVATLAAGATEWTTDAPLDPAATHDFAVRAVNEYGPSAWRTV